MPPACWKYVNCVISMPFSQTSHPIPHAPRVGDSQSSSTNLMSWQSGSMPSSLRLSKYMSFISSRQGFHVIGLVYYAASFCPEVLKRQYDVLKIHIPLL